MAKRKEPDPATVLFVFRQQSLTQMRGNITKQVFTQFNTHIQKTCIYNGLIPLDNNKRKFYLKA